MFSFIAFIFLGGYLLLKVSSENARGKYNTKLYEEQKKRKNNFLDKYGVTRKELSDFEEIMFKKTPEIKELIAEVEKVMGIKPPPYEVIENAYFAKKGKILDERNSRHGINDSWLWNWCCDKYYQKHYSSRDMDKAMFELMKWMDKELRSNGMRYEMMCSVRIIDEKEKVHKPIKNCEFDKYAAYGYYYEPLITKQ